MDKIKAFSSFHSATFGLAAALLMKNLISKVLWKFLFNLPPHSASKQ
jgi:hypothetical protein